MEHDQDKVQKYLTKIKGVSSGEGIAAYAIF